ncbi:hypothetical protein [Planctomicrobium piriforme]|uniref:hypothetical protein n=1 Tax=Planctomicrobium piriforme TaxID=1576369 RepID=UPI000B823D76|nr:hypothetical protein [Planctomicrobium piriforme]
MTKQLRQQQQLQLQQQVDAATENGVESDYIVTEPGDFTFDIFPVQPPAIAQAMWLFRFILGKDTREKVFEPAMADILLDYAEAVPFQKGWAAGWLQFCWWMRFLRLATSIVGADLGESISRMATWVCSGFRQKS